MLPASAIMPIGLVLLLAVMAVASYVARVRYSKTWGDPLGTIAVVLLILISTGYILSVETMRNQTKENSPPATMTIDGDVYEVHGHDGEMFIRKGGEFVPVVFVRSYYRRK